MVRRIIHRLLVLAGTTLVFLRFYPPGREAWISKLFFDDIIQTRVEAVSVQVISALGIPLDATAAYVSNLVALAQVFALLIQALAIAAIFYVITRWI